MKYVLPALILALLLTSCTGRQEPPAGENEAPADQSSPSEGWESQEAESGPSETDAPSSPGEFPASSGGEPERPSSSEEHQEALPSAASSAPASSAVPSPSVPSSAAPSSSPDPQRPVSSWPASTEADASVDLAETERQIIAYINRERANLGLEPLTSHASLGKAARIRSGEILRTGVFSHTRPDGTGWSTVLKTDVPLSTTAAGENLARVEYTSRTSSLAASASNWYGMWENSAGHYENMTSAAFTHVGIGIQVKEEDGTTYAIATALFAKPSEK